MGEPCIVRISSRTRGVAAGASPRASRAASRRPPCPERIQLMCFEPLEMAGDCTGYPSYQIGTVSSRRRRVCRTRYHFRPLAMCGRQDVTLMLRRLTTAAVTAVSGTALHHQVQANAVGARVPNKTSWSVRCEAAAHGCVTALPPPDATSCG